MGRSMCWVPPHCLQNPSWQAPRKHGELCHSRRHTHLCCRFLAQGVDCRCNYAANDASIAVGREYTRPTICFSKSMGVLNCWTAGKSHRPLTGAPTQNTLMPRARAKPAIIASSGVDLSPVPQITTKESQDIIRFTPLAFQ